MRQSEFESLREVFQKSETDKKIDIYINSENLTPEQYKELLRMFPINELDKLEEALD